MLLSTAAAVLCACWLTGSGATQSASDTSDRLVAGLADVCLRRLTDAVSAPMAGLRREVAALREQLAPRPPPPPACPPSWSRHGHSCYLIPPLPNSWPAAEHGCAQLDRRARLASVHPDNQAFVAQLVSGAGHPMVWIGLARTGAATFGWTDGSPVDFASWAPSEPNNPSEHCVHVYGPQHQSVTGHWNDASCSDSFHFLCRIDLNVQ
ncbi:lectin BRA-2-like [Amphibalanus amphitrite]|uniref:lectin BRA-2-like n=1 Tax=Amphibalanus amphitrite TaxID=1232801 RepID=UPI001C8FCD1D|nr:lectin BRA-2-like [Amphibalanus amphitrite]